MGPEPIPGAPSCEGTRLRFYGGWPQFLFPNGGGGYIHEGTRPVLQRFYIVSLITAIEGQSAIRDLELQLKLGRRRVLGTKRLSTPWIIFRALPLPSLEARKLKGSFKGRQGSAGLDLVPLAPNQT